MTRQDITLNIGLGLLLFYIALQVGQAGVSRDAKAIILLVLLAIVVVVVGSDVIYQTMLGKVVCALEDSVWSTEREHVYIAVFMVLLGASALWANWYFSKREIRS